MAYIDGHCDVLSKLLNHPEADFYDSQLLQSSLPRMQESGAMLQFFAIYVSERFAPFTFSPILKSIDLFYTHIVSQPPMFVIRTAADVDNIVPRKRIGALLSLEGVDAVPADLSYIRLLYQLGVRAIGLTWNHANWAGDGATEPRKGRLTRAGIALVKECERLGILVDVSHLSERGFWDVAQHAKRAFFASHSNVYDLCPHPRNLTEAQIHTIIKRDGMIGLTFVPDFVRQTKERKVKASELLTHIDYICARGGSFHIGFGSDFDGVDEPLQGLEHAGKYGSFHNLLLKHYSAQETDRFLYGNWRRFLQSYLPQKNE